MNEEGTRNSRRSIYNIEVARNRMYDFFERIA